MNDSTSPHSFRLRTTSAEQTEALGAALGALLPSGTTMALSGPLGAGKTCFVRGVATGLGIDPNQVCSPSFVYLAEYEGGRLHLVHADLYRLGDLPEDRASGVFEAIGLTEATESEALTVVEWWDNYRGLEPQRLVNVEFSVDSVEDRTIRLNLVGEGLETCAEFLKSSAGT